jgi:hypothetical protein
VTIFILERRAGMKSGTLMVAGDLRQQRHGTSHPWLAAVPHVHLPDAQILLQQYLRHPLTHTVQHLELLVRHYRLHSVPMNARRRQLDFMFWHWMIRINL